MYRWDKLGDKFWTTLVWLLPRRLVYWCAIRLGATALRDLSSTAAPELTFLDAIKTFNGMRIS